ncbi:hypothetical protein [Actinoplanes teichomyceticus]|uniref:Uncharacterized protein n=1 Tax=Actinoplanes teichomyceticus TaxID=1867 RepID=A0A561WIA2_ACTTI|nr:hypothetical protein [Actinoplanes teichomyceticus]TWG23588.1 hypothetical protein FHX34_102137 [Actinoplanes teichomyceticus]GIF16215.1 hypothetical protein Ate01nite_62470 [Actinoplanes teichomyceticus]
MTNQEESPVAGEDSRAREVAAENLLTAVARYTADDGPVDLLGPVDDLLAAVAGAASEEAVVAVLDAVSAIPQRFWSHAFVGDRPDIARTMAAGLIGGLRTALYAVVRPFDRQRDLLAAEQAVTELEQAEAQAREQLEAAVQRGDIAAVMSLRADAEITIPDQLATARAKLMGLQAEAAEVRLEQAEQDFGRSVDRAGKAKAAVEAALAEVHRLTAAAAEAEQAARDAIGVRDALRADASRRRAQLQEHQAHHARQRQDRIRQLAGLTPTA